MKHDKPLCHHPNIHQSPQGPHYLLMLMPVVEEEQPPLEFGCGPNHMERPRKAEKEINLPMVWLRAQYACPPMGSESSDNSLSQTCGLILHPFRRKATEKPTLFDAVDPESP